jgi:hypothetical protein
MEKLVPLFKHGGEEEHGERVELEVPLVYEGKVVRLQATEKRLVLRREGQPALQLPLSFELTFEMLRSKTLMMGKETCKGSKELGVAESIVLQLG